MALFQPSFVTPDVRGGLGNGVVDADGPFFVEWQVNGNSGLTRYCSLPRQPSSPPN